MIVLVPLHPFIRLAGLLANEEITRARIGHVVLGTPGIYFDFIQTQLQGSGRYSCHLGISLSF